VHQPHDHEVNELGNGGFARRPAQAHHPRPSELGDPDIDLALGYRESSRGLGAGPPINENALDD